MSDEEIRALEREAAHDPLARERLEAVWVRSGRGWHGEKLPHTEKGHLETAQERGVYIWRVKASADLALQLVYVPGDTTRCDDCHGSGRPIGPWDMARLPRPLGVPPEHCTFCRGEGAIDIKPFYIGRFQVLWRDYKICCETNGFALRPLWGTEYPTHPATDIAHFEGGPTDFVTWSGLRHPTINEWRWAALGPLIPAPDGHNYDDHTYDEEVPRALTKLDCIACGDEGVGLHLRPCLRRRLFPGEEGAEHYLTAEHPNNGGKGPRSVFDPTASKTPAREGGKSWCGAYDMVGNVATFASDPSGHHGRDLAVMGHSFRSRAGVAPCDRPGPTILHRRQDECGFRLALSGNARPRTSSDADV